MVKMLLLEQWYTLSTPQMEEALDDRLSFRRFVGLGLQGTTPGHSTISRFRQAVEVDGLSARLFTELAAQLDAQGLVLKAGPLLDATLVAALVRRPPLAAGQVGVLATRQAVPVGWTATSRWSRATSMPRYRSGLSAIRYAPHALTSRPALRIRARGPGNCSGSRPALWAGTTPLSHGLARAPGTIGLSRPRLCPPTLRGSWEHTRPGTYKGQGEGMTGYRPVHKSHNVG